MHARFPVAAGLCVTIALLMCVPMSLGASITFLAVTINGDPVPGAPAAVVDSVPGDVIVFEAYGEAFTPYLLRAYAAGLNSTELTSGTTGSLLPLAAGTLIDPSRTDGPFFGLSPYVWIDTATADYRLSSATQSPEDAVADAGGQYYLGTFTVEVGLDAFGTFVLTPDGRDVDDDGTVDSHLMDQAYASIEPTTRHGLTIHVASLCGNGDVDYGESCDDGNDIDGDGCDTNCTWTACGNGIVTGTEVCDDGNLIDADGCDHNCTITGCGNGVVTDPESCDDGNLVSGDGCDPWCTAEAGLDNATIALRAVAINGTPLPAGTSAVTAESGSSITVEARVYQWAPNVIRGIEAVLDSETYTSGDTGTLVPIAAESFVDVTRPDFVFAGWPSTTVMATPTPEFRAIAVTLSQEVADLGEDYYLGTFEIELSADASGVFILQTKRGDTNGDGHQDFTAITRGDISQVEPLTTLPLAIVATNLCGNGDLDDGEACDDGNDTNGDGCDNNCTATACGNGIVTPPETCDDGNLVSGDGCSALCAVEGVYPGASMALLITGVNGSPLATPTTNVTALPGSRVTFEAYASGWADDSLRSYGVALDIDGPQGSLAMVASGVVIDETRIDWPFRDVEPWTAVDTTETGPRLAAGVLNLSEAIADTGGLYYLGTFEMEVQPDAAGPFTIVPGDDGDTVLHGTVNYYIEPLTRSGITIYTGPFCGDNIQDGYETCDDGNLIDGDGCDSNCTPTDCGNGIVTFGEDCDDGNLAAGDGCAPDCTIEPGCGNGITEDGEDCDDGNATSGDGCDSNCTYTACGNGVVSSGEDCDDGNLENGDGCSDSCTAESVSCSSDLDCVVLINNCCQWSACNIKTQTCTAGIPRIYGDVAGSSFAAPANGAVNLTDVLCTLAAFGAGNLHNCPNADIAGSPEPPAGCPYGNGVVNLTDILKVLGAFGAPGSQTASFACDCPMNPR